MPETRQQKYARINKKTEPERRETVTEFSETESVNNHQISDQEITDRTIPNSMESMKKQMEEMMKMLNEQKNKIDTLEQSEARNILKISKLESDAIGHQNMSKTLTDKIISLK